MFLKKLKPNPYLMMAIGFISIVALFFYIDTLSQLDKIEYGIAVSFIFLLYFIQKFYNSLKVIIDKKTQYRCYFKKYIVPHGQEDESKWVLLEQTHTVLPFPPYIGLSIEDLLNVEDKYDEDLGVDYIDGTSFFSGKIESVRWDNTLKIFNCYVSPFRMSKENKLGAVLFYNIKHGWKIHALEIKAKKELESYLSLQNSKNIISEEE